jgi:hypothetical protein
MNKEFLMSKDIYDELITDIEEVHQIIIDRSNPTCGNLPVRFIKPTDDHVCSESRLFLLGSKCAVCGK